MMGTPLVNYSSDSSCEDGAKRSVGRKRKVDEKLPPLPSSFQDLYATPIRTSKVDDPILHGGRQRVNPHIEGNWPTHVYTEWIPTVEERKTIERLIKMYSPGDHEVHGFLVGELGVPMPLHISLSSSLSLNTEQRYDFLESLRSSIERTDVHVFDVLPHGLEWMPNSTQNRWFLVLQLDRPPEDELKRLLKASNETACSFGQPGLYTSNQPDSDLAHTSGLNETDSERLKISDTSESTSKEGDMTNAPFHVSIAWSLLKPPSELLDQLPPKPQSILSNLRIPVDVVKVKIGNTISTVSLKHVVPRVEL